MVSSLRCAIYSCSSGSTSAQVVCSQVANFNHPQYPELEDFGDMVLRGDGGVEAAGGTMTTFRSARTGRDYGRKSFGANYGTFSKHDPVNPVTNTVEYIHEKKTRQEDTPGRIEILSKGPAAVVARAAWSNPKVAVEQEYEFRAGQPYFILRTKIRPVDLARQQELVAINAQLQPHKLAKTFPNFPGEATNAEQPHFGWRTGSWVPDCAGLLAPPQFDESISLIVTDKTRLKGVRQGFWPHERPKPGKREIGQIELLGEVDERLRDADVVRGEPARLALRRLGRQHGRRALHVELAAAERQRRRPRLPAVPVDAPVRWLGLHLQPPAPLPRRCERAQRLDAQRPAPLVRHPHPGHAVRMLVVHDDLAPQDDAAPRPDRS